MKKFNHADYNKNLKEIARKLRNNSTPAEIKLWKELLRAKKMLGYQFLRQRPVKNYIADFMCKELRLIIEVDGESHNHEYQWTKDKSRQKELEDAGFTVLRFNDDEVFDDIQNVSRVLEQWIEVHPPCAPFEGGGFV
ncbi:MAG: DUF559 domain-containing protein [Bacteroidetes bacterium]|jgi:very-short-patch-repair endonuclease|nr:DUF559 domain-containing protein [Bacteroidota bacterium]